MQPDLTYLLVVTMSLSETLYLSYSFPLFMLGIYYCGDLYF